MIKAKYLATVFKNRTIRHLKWLQDSKQFSKERSSERLPNVVYQNKSLILRRLGNVDLKLQENKAVNLSLASKHIDGVLIKPNETFSFWYLVGCCTKRKGYLEGLTISGGAPSKGVGGGMCQFTNLIHFLVLHSGLDITEHHHHNGFDLFPDYGRQIPFGLGTSVMYNYLDYQFKNNTDKTYQLCVWVEDGYLCGELRSSVPEAFAYHLLEENAYFSREGDLYYRHNEIYRMVVDKTTGQTCSKLKMMENKAKVMYDASFIPSNALRD